MNPIIIIPYRDRADHLQQFYKHFEGQDLDIFVVEQAAGKPFNRGKLLNIGFLENPDRDYYVFHDVDMLPEDFSKYYEYPVFPIHMASAASQFDYKMPYPGYFGGVTAVAAADFEYANGYSNEFWGWGGEDDDLLKRLTNAGLKCMGVHHYRYTSLPHPPAPKGTLRTNEQRLKRGCATGLYDCQYTVVERKDNHIIVEI